MKALTVRQPWASMIVDGDEDGEHKTVEVRSRPTKHRGDLAIHAAARPDSGFEEFCAENGIGTFGAVIGVVTVTDCRPLTPADLDAAGLPNDFDCAGQWAWCLSDPRPCKSLPRKGKLSLWGIPDEQIVYL